MTVDLQAAQTFIYAHARLLERHRLAYLLEQAGPEPVVQTLRAYRNPDGGFGNAIEPDMRAPDSQPVGIHTVLEILHDVGVHDDEIISGAADWLTDDHARRRRHPVLPAERARLPAQPDLAARRRLVAPSRPPPTPLRCTSSASSIRWLEGADNLHVAEHRRARPRDRRRQPRDRLRDPLRGHFPERPP